MPDSPQQAPTADPAAASKFQWSKDLTDRHSDKLLVLGAVIFFVVYAHYSWAKQQTDFANAAMDLAKQFAAAFLTLIATGLAKRNGNGNGDNKHE